MGLCWVSIPKHCFLQYSSDSSLRTGSGGQEKERLMPRRYSNKTTIAVSGLIRIVVPTVDSLLPAYRERLLHVPWQSRRR
jgi:hypothetical protein